MRGVYHDLATTHGERVACTWRIPAELRERLNAAAVQLQVGASDLVDYLLSEALDQVDHGQLAVPTRVAPLRMIDRRKRG